jgi:Zn-dependent peptidase ImmA (M78 family)/DNA-binding XRE family transcriptional regulator
MIYGERIKQARELNGLTQTQLANRIGANQSFIAHIEQERRMPSPTLLEAIANQTGFLPPFFEQPPIDNFPLGSLSLRARKSLTAREEAQAYQYAKTIFEQVGVMARGLNIPDLRLPNIQEKPSTVARIARTELGLPPDTPIKNLTGTLEKAGVLIFPLPLILEKTDAFSTWADLVSERPIIAVLLGKPGDRLRFSISHELGHLVMHRAIRGRVSIIENEADQFAAEFLLPEVAMRQEIVKPVTLTSIADLKVRWKVSMQSLIRRAYNLRIVTNRQYRYLFEQLSSHGWRRKEPIDIQVEKPQVIRKMIELLYGSMQEYATRMHLTTEKAIQFTSPYVDKNGHLMSPDYNGTVSYKIATTQLQERNLN